MTDRSGLDRAWVSRIMLQSLAHGPMMPTGMRHIYRQHPAGYACAVCGGLAATEEGISHFWANPVTGPTRSTTTVYREEACPTAAQEGTSVAVPTIPAVHDSVHASPVGRDSIAGLRQSLVRLGATGHDTSNTLRDMFDPVGPVGLDA